jgi:putative endonuclease
MLRRYLYTGITSNLERRIIEHISGIDQNSYTFKRRPINLKFYAEFTEPSRAIETEKQIKKWSKAKKIALINNKFEDLKNLAKRSFNRNILVTSSGLPKEDCIEM